MEVFRDIRDHYPLTNQSNVSKGVELPSVDASLTISRYQISLRTSVGKGCLVYTARAKVGGWHCPECLTFGEKKIFSDKKVSYPWK